MERFKDALDKLEFDKVRQRLVRYAVSESGKELLLTLTVSTSVDEVRKELSRVSELKRLLEQEEGFLLEGIYPVRNAIQKSSVEGSVLAARELFQISSTVQVARILRSFLLKRKEIYPLLWEICESLFVDKVLEFNIDQAIDESGAVRANASKELQAIRRATNDKYDSLKKRLESILKGVSDLGFGQDEIITTREGRMVIPVKAEHKNRVPGFIHSASSSGATVFIEPTDTLELNNDIRSLQFQEQREIERILKTLTEQVGRVREDLLTNLNILSRADALQAKAKYSIEILGVQPVVNASGVLQLVKARHPILVLNHGYNQTVPLDLELGKTYSTLVISGPNAGGKSVAMKCVGLLVLMVQAGLHIPAADQSVIRIFGHVLVDIGDEQSIENDLSTFSSHLANLKGISEVADADSLVLIDEIGSGTDPAEGGAIASALLESLTQRGTYTIATTHHGALKLFAYETDGVENGAMEFNQSTLTPTYRFKSGVPGSSYALEMAERLGFGNELLRRSRDLLGAQSSKLEELITELERSTQRYSEDIEVLQQEKSKLDDLIRKYEAKIFSQASELKETKRKALDEAKQIIENANALIEQSIREIRESSADRTVIKNVRNEMGQLEHDTTQQRNELESEERKLESSEMTSGNFVRLLEGTEIGQLESISPDKKTGVVVFGNVKMKMPMKNLVRAKPTILSLPRREEPRMEKPRMVQGDLDLRGLTGEEAIPLVDKLIDDAVVAGLYRVDIIHGKGTGSLRKKIADFLTKHPRVRSFRLGEWNEGGTGATVVELLDT